MDIPYHTAGITIPSLIIDYQASSLTRLSLPPLRLPVSQNRVSLCMCMCRSEYLMNSRRGPSNESHGWRMDATSTVSIANVNTNNETTTRPVHRRNDAQHCTLALNALRKSASPLSLPPFIIMLPIVLKQTTELMNRLMVVESTSTL